MKIWVKLRMILKWLLIKIEKAVMALTHKDVEVTRGRLERGLKCVKSFIAPYILFYIDQDSGFTCQNNSLST